MIKLFVLIVAVTVIQFATCFTKDISQEQYKLDTINQYLKKAPTEINKINESDEKEVQNAADDFCKELKDAVSDLNTAVKDNTRNNELGKQLYQISHRGNEFDEWAQTKLHKDSKNLQANLKLAIEKYSKLIQDVSEAFPQLDKSSENAERSSTSLADFIDKSLVLIKKLHYHLEFKKFTNAELRGNINEVLNEDLASLEKVTGEKLKINELVFQGLQLGYLVNNLIDRLNNWIQQAGPSQSELKVIAEHTVLRLREIVAGTQRHSNPKATIENMKVMYKLWLSGVNTNVRNLDVLPKGKPEDIVRAALFDTVGIVMNYKTIFGHLAKTNF